MNKVYFDNDVHDKLVGMASHLMMLTLNTPNSHKVAVDLHQTLLGEYLQDELDSEDAMPPLDVDNDDFPF